jgi:hypothetical protein
MPAQTASPVGLGWAPSPDTQPAMHTAMTSSETVRRYGCMLVSLLFFSFDTDTPLWQPLPAYRSSHRAAARLPKSALKFGA